jgi:hypothetical protein
MSKWHQDMVSSHHEVPHTDLRTMPVMRGNITDQKVNRGIGNEIV